MHIRPDVCGGVTGSWPCLGVLHLEKENLTANASKLTRWWILKTSGLQVMFLRDKFRLVAAAVLLSVIWSVQSQEDKFAGNLIPDSNANSDHTADDDDGSGRTPSVAGTNQTGTVDEVDGTPSTPDSVDPPPKKKSVKKAAQPPGKPKSVGFIPPHEEEDKGSEEDVEKVEERQMVTSIPTLPAR